MGNPELRPHERPEVSWAAATMELHFLCSLAGIDRHRLQPYIAEAESVVPLRAECEEAFRSGRPFIRQVELQRAEDALRVVNGYRLMTGARVLDRVVSLIRTVEGPHVEEPPRTRFSDAAILEVFGRLLHRWDLDPDDPEMTAVMKRFLWLSVHGGKGR